MAVDSDVYDVALLGTGVAPLAVASELIAKGKRVLLLNPEFDFFRENSELPFDPFVASHSGDAGGAAERLRASQPDAAAEELRPAFPGAVELSWPGEATEGFRDSQAPHVRGRDWIWLRPDEGRPEWDKPEWDRVEELFVTAHDQGLNPGELAGLSAVARLPGFTSRAADRWEDARGIQLPRMADVDVVRYRNGLLEFVRERLGNDGMVTSADHIELTPDGLRFYQTAGYAAGLRTAKVRQGVLAFWTPRLTRWVQTQAIARLKKAEQDFSIFPTKARILEQWSVMSRVPLRTTQVGFFARLAVWAEVEGPFADSYRLRVLRMGEEIGLEDAPDFASARSFDEIYKLCRDVLGWEKFSVNDFSPRLILQWPARASGALISFPHGELMSHVVPNADGPLVQVVRQARVVAARYG
ncbi:MAG: hypothetical protein AB7P04_01860 [Bacteriovoracia bacterium]